MTGTTLTWDLSALTAFAHRALSAKFQVPPDVSIAGTALSATTTVSTANADAVPANNTAETSVVTTASLDPNNKQVLTSSRTSATHYLIGTDEWLDHTIQFQNTGTDTAFNVIIVDTLEADLDPASIQWGAASHARTPVLEGSGVIKFIFTHILLPDGNVNEAASHGFVSFRIQPQAPLAPGTALTYAADIYFDFNPPVHTADAVVVAETNTGLTAHHPAYGGYVLPNPAQDDVRVIFDHADEAAAEARVLGMDGRSVRTYPRLNGSARLDVRMLSSARTSYASHPCMAL